MIHINNNDNFNVKDGVIIALLLLIGILIAAAKHSEEIIESPILEATNNRTVVYSTDGVGFK